MLCGRERFYRRKPWCGTGRKGSEGEVSIDIETKCK